MIPCCCSYFCVSLCLYCHILLLVPPFNTRPFVERPATLKYVKRIQQMMLPKPLNFTLQLRPSPPPSCWDVRSNEGHDVVHLKPLGTWPLRILRYSNTSGFHGFNTEFPLHKLRSRKPTNRYKLVRKHQPRDHQQFQFVNFVRTWKFAAPADSSVSLAHPQVLPGACRGTPSATPDLTTRHLEMDPGSLSGPVQLESLRFKKMISPKIM